MTDAREIFSFLDGSAEFDGVWFGDNHPIEKGVFWWRKHLRKAVESQRAEIERLNKEWGMTIGLLDEAIGAYHDAKKQIEQLTAEIERYQDERDGCVHRIEQLQERVKGLERYERAIHNCDSGRPDCCSARSD